MSSDMIHDTSPRQRLSERGRTIRRRGEAKTIVRKGEPSAYGQHAPRGDTPLHVVSLFGKYHRKGEMSWTGSVMDR